MDELQGQTAFVTGAGAGIGQATALRLARLGCAVAIVGHNRKDLEETASRVKDTCAKTLICEVDIRDSQAMANAVNQTIEAFGRLDIVVANAGINGTWTGIDELKPEDWDKTIGTNLTGTYLTLHHTVPHLKKNGGSIVIVSSVNGTRVFSNTGATAYACTKAAQLAMAKMLALELAKHNIRVNAVCPGAIDTEIDDNTRLDNQHIKQPVEYPQGMIPLTDGKSGTSEDVADLIAFLSSPRAKHITGTPVWIDGAESLLVA